MPVVRELYGVDKVQEFQRVSWNMESLYYDLPDDRYWARQADIATAQTILIFARVDRLVRNFRQQFGHFSKAQKDEVLEHMCWFGLEALKRDVDFEFHHAPTM